MKDAGVLLAISSLPSRYGIGDFGAGAYAFVDMLSASKVRYWQLLPFNRIGYGNSPYQAYSSVAGDEIYIDLDGLVSIGLLEAEELEDFNASAERVDYDAVRSFKETFLMQAYSTFQDNFSQYEDEYRKFLNKNNDWLHTYAVFTAIKRANHLRCWLEWHHDELMWPLNSQLDLTPYSSEIAYQKFLQFMFYRQWFALKRYANSHNVEMMGDIPFYVGLDSADVWGNQKFFMLDEQRNPTHVAGVPPDYFSEFGQRWGNPLYNWPVLQTFHFSFWVDRLEKCSQVFDIVRIDHFRAFDTYWAIPATCPTAVEGQWVEAPGYALFDRVFHQLPNLRLIAEDLGEMRPEVAVLRDHYHLPGMKIIQFTFDPKEHNNDFNDRANMVIYTGTHDNQTLKGWLLAQSAEVQEQTMAYLQNKGYHGSFNQQMVGYCLDSIAKWAIVPLQDILALDDSARMNTPGTLGTPNWEWKLVNFTATKQALEGWFAAAVSASQRQSQPLKAADKNEA